MKKEKEILQDVVVAKSVTVVMITFQYLSFTPSGDLLRIPPDGVIFGYVGGINGFQVIQKTVISVAYLNYHLNLSNKDITGFLAIPLKKDPQ